MSGPQITITLVRSLIGVPDSQRKTVKGLGLRRPSSRVVRPDTPEIRGMIRKVTHLVSVEGPGREG